MVKICPVCRAQFDSKAALAAHMASAHPARSARGRTNRRVSRSAGTQAAGSVVFSRNEYLGSFKSVNIPLQPGKTKASQLDNISKIFELYRWQRLTFSLRPTVGAQADGVYFAGVSYEADHIPASATDIAACSPAVSNPVSRESSITVPVGQLMGRPWLSTTAKSGEGADGVAGYFCLSSDKNIALWMQYTVVLSGPTSVSRTSDRAYLYSVKNQKWYLNDVQHEWKPEPESGHMDLDIELDTGTPSVVTSTIQKLQQLYQGLQALHSYVVDGVTYVHAVATGILNVVPPAVGVAAIVHRRALPFRASLELRQLC